MDPLVALGRTLGISLGAGVNLYATVALLGLAQRYAWVTLPPQFQVFDHDLVIGLALVLYAIEFFADKIPWVDSLWDAVHTLVRPLGGALIAIAAQGESTPVMTVMMGLLGATVAAGGHATKAGTRVVANVSPEPFTNWLLSLGEDVFVVGLVALALQHPIAALVVTVLTLATMVAFAGWIARAITRRFRGATPEAGG